MTFGINGAELIILVLLAVLILGPEKLPEYTRKLTEWIRNLRRMAEGAKSQFKDETGTDFDEIDWKKYDPRQYDPRRIIKDALAEPVDGPGSDPTASTGSDRPDGPSSSSKALTSSSPATSSSAAVSDRGEWRSDLHAVRSQRDELRDDLKDMDPRALFFGKSSSRSGSAKTTGTGAAVAAGAAAGVADTGAADATGATPDQPASGQTDQTEVSASTNEGGSDAMAAPAAEVSADAVELPAPFDVDAT